MTLEKLRADEARDFRNRVQRHLDIEPGLGAFMRSRFLADSGHAAALFGGDFRDADGSVSSACTALGIDVVCCASLDATYESPGFKLTPTHEHLAWVRTEFHTPSYVVADTSLRLLVVSDSDYYWGVAAEPSTVSCISKINASLAIDEDDIKAFCESDEPHDRRIGQALRRFYKVCRESRRR